MAMKPWCVAWIPDDKRHDFDIADVEWCTCRAQPKGTKHYQDHIRTKCGQVVVCTVGIERRTPSCPECRKKL